MANMIDLNRGAMCCRDKLTGMYVYMYLDTPGVYLSEHGSSVDKEIARMAGFDVVKYEKERVKRDRVNLFTKALSEELEAGDEAEAEVLMEQGGWTVIAIGLGHAHVKDPEGNIVTHAPIPVESAKVLVDRIAPKVDNAISTGAPAKGPAKLKSME